MKIRLRRTSLLLCVSGAWIMTVWLFIIAIDQGHVYKDFMGSGSRNPLPWERSVGNGDSCLCPCNKTIHPTQSKSDSVERPIELRIYSTKKTPVKYVPGGVPEKLIQPKVTDPVWPGNEDSDRVLAQMNLQHTVPNKTIKILVLGSFGAVLTGKQQFVKDDCPVKACQLIQNRNLMATADVILFRGNGNEIQNYMQRRRNYNQITVWYELESAINSQPPPTFVNWTASYRQDSTINTPYERFTPYKEFENKLPPPSKNYAAGKSKMAAWFVSNCNANSKRGVYVKELEKYIDIDIYGSCGKLKCSKRTSNCNSMLSKDYRFYLAFENSNCVDYITEKFYWNGLYNDIIPVVFGARPEDYEKVAPPMSYIHADDFESPRHLADFLKALASDDDLYNQYFRWKGTGSFVNTKFWCRLCAMAHEAERSNTRMYYEDTTKWWRGPGVCSSPTNSRWGTWRNVERVYSYKDNETLVYIT